MKAEQLTAEETKFLGNLIASSGGMADQKDFSGKKITIPLSLWLKAYSWKNEQPTQVKAVLAVGDNSDWVKRSYNKKHPTFWETKKKRKK